jgi:membrane associated rhomboid family serine protease
MTPWVRRLLIANVVVFLAMPVLSSAVVNQLVLVPVLVPIRPWTVITYQFLHANFMHLLFNMILLFFFGPRLEMRLGSRHFIAFYLVSGIGGAVLSVFTPQAAIVGASGALFGVLLGFARYWPREKIWIWALFPVEARVLVTFLAVFSVVVVVLGQGGNIAHLAHLGGFVGGWIYLKVLESRSPGRKFRQKLEAVSAPAVGNRDLSRWRQVDPSNLHPLNRQEFERILAKAEGQGLSSLSGQERAFMERFGGGH